MPPRHPDIAHALGPVRATLKLARRTEALTGAQRLGLLVACSGGRDSVALSGLLALVAEADRLALTLGHVDHGLRPESAAEAAHVQALADGLGVPFVGVCLALDADAPGLAARARTARHEALARMRSEVGAHRVALAHTATDQAETVLMHLSRGAGLRGLAGMAALEADAPVVRPLLELPRAATGPLCAHLGLTFVDDPTNAALEHPRIRIREEVLPALATIRGGVESALAASARAAREADDALQAWIGREVRARSLGASRYDLSEWRGLPRAIRVGLLKAIATRAGLQGDAIGRRTLQSVDAGLMRGGPKQWALAGGRALRSDGTTLTITSAQRGRTPPEDAT